MMRFALALSLCALALPVSAQTAVPDAAQPDTPKVDPSKKICHPTGLTGTRLGPRRRCMTASDWAEQDRLKRLDVERVTQTRSSQTSSF